MQTIKCPLADKNFLYTTANTMPPNMHTLLLEILLTSLKPCNKCKLDYNKPI